MSQGKIGIVAAGMGGRGAWATGELLRHPEFELRAIVDKLPARAELVAEELKLDGVARYDDLGRCLRECKSDAVAIFTPDGTHADLAVPALEAGRFVFVEKPLDVREDRLDRIIAADGRAGGRTFVGFNLRYAPVYEKIHQLVAEGVAGQVLTVQADEFYNGGRTYFRRWNRKREWGGGLWVTKASHDFDLLYWMAGAAPQTVYASASLDYYKPRADAAANCRDCRLNTDCPDRYEAWSTPDSLSGRLIALTERETGQKPDLCLFNSDKDTFDHGVATVSFANHAIGVYTLNVVAGFTNRTMRVAGTKAAIEGDLEAAKIVIRRRDPSGVEEIDLSGGSDMHGGGDARLFNSFAAFVRGRPTPVIRPREAAVAVRIGLAATRSCDQGQAVRM